MKYRTRHCDALRPSDTGSEVTLSGWVDSRRGHGGVIFIDLRDREGITPVVFRPEEYPAVAEQSHIRDVIAFPKNNHGKDLLTHSSVTVDFKQLRELYILSTAKKV